MILLYIDPGSGTIIFQLLIAGLAAIVSYSKRVRMFFTDMYRQVFRKK